MSAASTSSTAQSQKKLRASVPTRRRQKTVRLAPITARDVDVELGTKSVPSPLTPGTFDTVPFNRRVDVLEDERSNHRISTSQYEIGRIVQAIFERASGAKLGSGGWNPGGSRDQTIAHELQIIYAIEDAETVRKYLLRIERAIGTVGARFLKQMLADRVSFAHYAAARGKGGERGVTQVASHFRILLEGLDDAWAARGATVLEADAEGEMHPRIRAEAPSGEAVETDERGRVVPRGHGHRWGRRREECEA